MAPLRRLLTMAAARGGLTAYRTPMPRPRFKVSTVTGYRIVAETTTRVGGQTIPHTSYRVLDTAFCHRIVATFPAPEGPGGDMTPQAVKERSDDYRRAAAHALCAELNGQP